MRKHLLTTVALTAFQTGGGWKKDADGKLELDASGNPIFINSTGAEQSVDGGTISRLNGEARQHREGKEAAETKLKAFEGLDPVKAKAALETVGKLDQKTLIDAGEVDRVRTEMASQYETQLNEAKAEAQKYAGQRDDLVRSTAFKGSKFLQERLAVPVEMFEATFARNFKVEDGKIIPHGPDGNPIYSKKRMGEIADFDEAAEMIVENYAYKDSILKAAPTGGSGNGGAGGGRGGSRIVKRDDFQALSPAEQQATAAAAQKGEIQIVD